MPSKAQQEATKRYEKKHYRQMTIKPKIEENDHIRAHAAERGESLTRFLVRAAKTQIDIDTSEK